MTPAATPLFTDDDYPADPYPGAWPQHSYVHRDGAGYPVGELAEGGVPVLAYGSNRCPAKISWLRAELGLTGPVAVLAALTHDVSAVWAAGFRARDGARPATLTWAQGARETHAVWWATPEQLAVLDVCEGRGVRHDLARLRGGLVHTAELGTLDPWLYVAHDEARRPLLVAGAPVRCLDVDQEHARALVGVPAATDGLPLS